MIFRLIRLAIQELNGGPDGDSKKNGKLVAILCVSVVAVLLIIGAVLPDGARQFFRFFRLFVR